MQKTALLVALALGASLISLQPSTAQISAEIVIGTPPPPVRIESVPVPRPGYLWAPGYWAWDGRQHVWSPGHWELARPEETFVVGGWVRAPGGWRFVPGHWERFDERHRPPGHDRDDFCPPGQAKKGRC